MGLYIGDRKFNDLHRGGEPIGAVYQGTSKIWSRPPQGMRWEQAYSIAEVAAANGIDLDKEGTTAIKQVMVEGLYPSLGVRLYGDEGMGDSVVAPVAGYVNLKTYHRLEWIAPTISMGVFNTSSGGMVLGKREPIPGSRDIHAQVDVWRHILGKVPATKMEDTEAIFEVSGVASFTLYASGQGTLKAPTTGETINVTFPTLPKEDPGEGAASRHARLHLIVHAGRAYAAVALPGQHAQVIGSVSVPTMPDELTVQLDSSASTMVTGLVNKIGTSLASKRMSLSTGPFARADTVASGIVLP